MEIYLLRACVAQPIRRMGHVSVEREKTDLASQGSRRLDLNRNIAIRQVPRSDLMCGGQTCMHEWGHAFGVFPISSPRRDRDSSLAWKSRSSKQLSNIRAARRKASTRCAVPSRSDINLNSRVSLGRVLLLESLARVGARTGQPQQDARARTDRQIPHPSRVPQSCPSVAIC